MPAVRLENGKTINVTPGPGQSLDDAVDEVIAEMGTAEMGTGAGEQSMLGGLSRAYTHGLTMGSSDELGAGVAAAAAHRGPLTQGINMLLNPLDPESYQNESLGDVYSTIHSQIGDRRKAFDEQHPVASTAAEIAGGVSGGVVTAKKAAGTKVGQVLAKNLPKWAQAAGIGATEGGIYGFLSSDPGERGEGAAVGAAVGAVAAPVLGWGVDKVGHGAFTLSRWAKNKLASTDRSTVLRAIRRALADEGLDPEDAVRIYESLGPEGTLMDVSSNLQVLTRAAADLSGSVRGRARNLIHERMVNQGSRLLKYAERLMGKNADELTSTVAQISERRLNTAKPIYDAAYAQGIQLTDNLKSVLGRKTMKSALAQAKDIAEGYGDEFAEGSLRHLHYAKMALYDAQQAAYKRGNSKLGGAINQTRKDLLSAIGEQNTTYLRANNIWADESMLLDAVEAGQKFFKLSVREMREQLSGMSQSERELYQMGALSAFEDMFDNTQYTADLTRKFNTPAITKKLGLIFDDENASKAFVESLDVEGVFVRSRNTVAGGSQTSGNLAGQKWLQDSIQPDTLATVARATGDPVGAVLAVGQRLLKEEPLSAGVLKQMGDLLLDQGLSPDEARKIMTSPRVTMALKRMSEQYGPLSARAGAGIAAPIIESNRATE